MPSKSYHKEYGIANMIFIRLFLKNQNIDPADTGGKRHGASF